VSYDNYVTRFVKNDFVFPVRKLALDQIAACSKGVR